MSARTLAARANIDSGGLARLEWGKVSTPRPRTLRNLALALNISLADLFTRAGYVIPQDLPDIDMYLRLKYQYLPDESLDAILREVQRLIAQCEQDAANNTAQET